jgi:hypothetical protein
VANAWEDLWVESGIAKAPKYLHGAGMEAGDDGARLTAQHGKRLRLSVGIMHQYGVSRGVLTGNTYFQQGMGNFGNDACLLRLYRLDQTTRLHAELKPAEGAGAWREISRPQVHGYDLLDGVFLSPLRFTSIGDEKVVRLFDAPQSFITLAGNLLKIQLNEGQVSSIQWRPNLQRS